MSKFVSIAIDGPAGAGKSTMARACAQALGYLYVDTGAIYRTVGYYMRLMGVGPKDKDGIARLIDEVNIDIRYEDGVQHMILNGADVTGGDPHARNVHVRLRRVRAAVRARVSARYAAAACPDAQRRHGWPRYRDGRAAEGRRENFS